MALSTEWVALKTGQVGSGGVEYSLKDSNSKEVIEEIQNYDERTKCSPD